MPIIVPPGTEGLEGLTLNGLDLNDGASFVLEALDFGKPEYRSEWANGTDADGDLLTREPRLANRTITARVRVVQQTTNALSLEKVEQVVQNVRAAARTTGGVALVWTPYDTTVNELTFYVLQGNVQGLPISHSGEDAGYLVRSPILTLELVCGPYGYGDEVLYGTSTTSSDPIVELVVSDIPGDAPADGTLVVTDMSTHDRRFLEWGQEGPNYDAATSLYVHGASMTLTGYNGWAVLRTGEYDPSATGANSVRITATSSYQAMCRTPRLTHVGSYRVRARVYGGKTTSQVRLAWQVGEGVWTRNPAASLVVANDWCDLDLGTIEISEATTGTHSWRGVIEAIETGGSTATVDVNGLQLIPIDSGYGKAVSVTGIDSTTPIGWTGYDTFIQAPGALSGKTLPIGGTWTTSGDALDFSVYATTTMPLYRGSAAYSDVNTGPKNGRLAIASGTASMTNTDVLAWFTNLYYATNALPSMGCVARYVDGSNFLSASLYATGTSTCTLIVEKTKAGTLSTVSYVNLTYKAPSRAAIRLNVTSGGDFTCTLYQVSSGTPFALGPEYASITGYDADLATGGTLDDGKAGVVDYNSGSAYGYYAAGVYLCFNGVYITAPSSDAVVYSGRRARIGVTERVHEASAGTYWGTIPTYRGGPVKVPCAGAAGASSRFAVRLKRKNVESFSDTEIADSTKVELYYRPLWTVARGAG